MTTTFKLTIAVLNSPQLREIAVLNSAQLHDIAVLRPAHLSAEALIRALVDGYWRPEKGAEEIVLDGSRDEGFGVERCLESRRDP